CHTGGDCVTTDSLRTVLAGDVQGQCRHATLGRGVRAAAEATDDGEGRCHVDDGRAGSHVRYDVAGQPKRGTQHQAEEVVQRLVVSFVQRFGAADAGIVDEEVDSAPPLDGQVNDLLRRIVGGQVDGDRRHPV